MLEDLPGDALAGDEGDELHPAGALRAVSTSMANTFGAGTGGREIARAYAREGARVVVANLQPLAAPEEMATKGEGTNYRGLSRKARCTPEPGVPPQPTIWPRLFTAEACQRTMSVGPATVLRSVIAPFR